MLCCLGPCYERLAACSVWQAGLGAVPAFRVPEYKLQSVFELPLVVLLGALCGLAAAAFKASSQVRTHGMLSDADFAATHCRSIQRCLSAVYVGSNWLL